MSRGPATALERARTKLRVIAFPSAYNLQCATSPAVGARPRIRLLLRRTEPAVAELPGDRAASEARRGFNIRVLRQVFRAVATPKPPLALRAWACGRCSPCASARPLEAGAISSSGSAVSIGCDNSSEPQQRLTASCPRAWASGAAGGGRGDLADKKTRDRAAPGPGFAGMTG